MNWETPGADVEFVGVIAVMAKLIYLSIKVRRNTNLNASAVRQSFRDYTARPMFHGVVSREIQEIFDKTCMNGSKTVHS